MNYTNILYSRDYINNLNQLIEKLGTDGQQYYE